MINEDYCSYEVAKLLKEKRFDEKCNAFYINKDIMECGTAFYVCDEMVLLHPKYIKSPTHQKAMKWLRKKYNIYIRIQPDFPSDKDYKMCWCWSAGILHENCISTKGYQCYIENYEKAVEAALKYVLENLI